MLKRIERPHQFELLVVRYDPALPLAIATELDLAVGYYQYDDIVVSFAPVEDHRPSSGQDWQNADDALPGVARLLESIEDAEARGAKITGRAYGTLCRKLSLLAVLIPRELEVSADVELDLPAFGSVNYGRSTPRFSFDDTIGDTGSLPPAASARLPRSLMTASSERKYGAVALLQAGIAARVRSSAGLSIHSDPLL